MVVQKSFAQATIAVRVMVLTVQFAKQLLATIDDSKRRSIRRDNVEKWKRTILSGGWKINGEGIKIDRNGRMIDGQHRCLAVVETGIPIKIVVTYGLDPDCYTSLDQGLGRSAGDALRASHGDIPNAYSVSAALRWVYLFESKLLREAHPARLTHAEVLALFDQHPKIIDSCKFQHSFEDKRLLKGSSVVALHYLAARVDKPKADEFYSRLANGTGLVKGTISWLRERLIEEKSDAIRTADKLSKAAQFALVYEVWDRYRQGIRCCKKDLQVIVDEFESGKKIIGGCVT
jgi:hypothetical protein